MCKITVFESDKLLTNKFDVMKRLWMSLVLIVSFSALSAEPMWITFSDMMKQSKTIVFCQFLGRADTSNALNNDTYLGNYLLKVEEVFKGDVKEKIIGVGRAHGEVFLKNGRRYIAFINQNNEFEWYGEFISYGKKSLLDDGLIKIEGFYDYNAYLVGPSNISISNLKQYIKNDYFTNNVRGSIYFFDSDLKQMKRSDISLSVSYYYSADSTGYKVVDENMPKTELGPPSVRLGSWDNEIYINYEENLVRPLKIIGQLNSISFDTIMEAMFWVEAPEELDYKNFIKYVSDTSLGPPVYHIKIEDDQGEVYTLKRQASPPSSVMIVKDKEWHFSSSDDPTAENEGYINWSNGAVLTFFPYKDNGEERDYTREKLVRSLRISNLEGEIILENKEKRKVTISLEKTEFSENPNYKK
jgi:hypothetical protein